MSVSSIEINRVKKTPGDGIFKIGVQRYTDDIAVAINAGVSMAEGGIRK